jgi:hypothetical protein
MSTSDYERYQNNFQSRGVGAGFPFPWNTTLSIDGFDNVLEFFPVWESENRRLWSDLQASASLNQCDMCERVVEMAQSSSAAKINTSSQVSSTWWMNKGSLVPLLIDFKVFEQNIEILNMKIYSVVEDSDNSVFLVI